MSASQLIHYFWGHPETFGFQTSLPPHNITLNPVIKRTNQSFSDFQTSIGAADYATLNTEQLISHTKTAFVVTLTSLQGSDGGVSAASEVHELLTMIHDILDSALSKWACNTAHVLAYPSNSASLQCCEVWVSNFPFFTTLRKLFLSIAALTGV